MGDYLEAYRNRMIRNDKMLMSLIGKLKAKGFKDISPNGYDEGRGIRVKNSSFIEIGKDYTFGFSEVPYRWYLRRTIKPPINHRSSVTIKEWFDVSELPSIDEIVKLLK